MSAPVIFFCLFGFRTDILLRPEKMELQMKAICEGRKNRTAVVHESVEMYREVFIKSVQPVSYTHLTLPTKRIV